MTIMTRPDILFCGCSFTAGAGLIDGKNNPNLWTNRIASLLNADRFDNIAMIGRNNYWIFLETLCAVLKNRYDIVFVAWSSIPRYYFHAGLELYSVHTMLTEVDINLVNREKISGTWLQETGDRLRKLHNDHWDMVDLVKYVNILDHVQHSRGGRVFFVNALGPWSDNFFVEKSIELPSELDSYTYDLLQCDLRDDHEILLLYKMIHQHYREFGTIRPELWLNLYCSLKHMQIDDASSTDVHPGIKSQEIFAQYLWPRLLQKIDTV